MAQAQEDDEIDGRTRRSIRTRNAIVDATIALVEAGDLRPTGPRVAAAAQVSVRSIFQHFDDLETLHAAVAERVFERVSDLVVAVPADEPLATRLVRFTHQRAILLDAVSPIRRAANVHGPFSPEIAARLHDAQSFLREEAARTFAPELEALGDRRAEALDAVDAALSWAPGVGLRAGRGRSRAEAEAVVMRLVRGALLQ